MKAPLVSIITLTYRHGDYIGQCIESVLAQTHEAWELLIMDDGSPDNTAEVVAGYKDPRIRYLPQAHLGIIGMHAHSNRALAESKGEFIAILEGDDFWPTDKLEAALAAFDAPDVTLVYGITQFADSGGLPWERFIPAAKTLEGFPAADFNNEPIGRAARGILLSHSLWTCSVSTVIRRSVLLEIGGFHSIHDGSLVDRPTFLTLSMAGRFRFLNRVMGYWRQYGHNSSANIGVWKNMAEGISIFVRDFMARNADQLGLTVEESRLVHSYWKRNVSVSKIGHGRALLWEGDGRGARREFREAMSRVDRPRHALSAGIGWIASWAHLNVEWLYYAVGKPSGIRQFRRRD